MPTPSPADHLSSIKQSKFFVLGILLGALIGSIAGILMMAALPPTTSPVTATNTSHRSSQAALITIEHGDQLNFSEVINLVTGHPILPFDPSDPHHTLVSEQISAACEVAIETFNQADSPILEARRINEASRHFEDFLQQSLAAHPELTCEIPKSRDGKPIRSGYPDLLITHLPSGLRVYLDPKLFRHDSSKSSFRTFYFQPRRETSKIHYPALHLLAGFAHNGDTGNWKFTSWKLVDLHSLRVTLKSEFNASNLDLYRDESIIQQSGPSAAIITH